MKIAFISGAYNSPNFILTIINIWKARKVAKRLWREGYAVICPHTNSGLFGDSSQRNRFLQGYLGILDRLIPDKDVMVMLKGWQKSTGASLEWQKAKQMGLKIIYEGNRDLYVRTGNPPPFDYKFCMKG